MILEEADISCLACLASKACSIRFDKKGRPYSVCLVCGTRTFPKGRAALAGWALLPDMVESYYERGVSESPEFRQSLAAKVADFVASLSARAPAVEAPASKVVLADAARLEVAS